MSRRVRLVVVVLVGVVLQLSLFNDLRTFDVAPDTLLLLTVLIAAQADRETAILTGFAVGLLYDMALPTPLGISALVHAVVASLVVSARENAVEPNAASAVVGVGAMSATGVGLFAVIGELFGQDTFEPVRVLGVAAVVAVWNVVLLPAARRPVRWAFAGREPRPSRLRSMV